MNLVFDKKKLMMALSALVFVVVLGTIMALTVFKTSTTTETVAPTVPQIKPEAAAGPTAACYLAFTI